MLRSKLFLENELNENHNLISLCSEINHLKKTAKQFPSGGIIALAKGMRDRKDRTQVLARFSGIKLFVCGAQDPIVPLKVSETVAKRTSSELIILPKTTLL